jgi:large subunit ribosomal protein L10
MALTQEKKEAVVANLVEHLSSSKITIMAQYTGLTVQESQELRAKARENGTTLLVVKNRLVKVAMSKVDSLKDVDTSDLEGQLMYAFNNEDEVAPAQVLADFAKEHPASALKGAIDANGAIMDEAQVKQLASLPSKEQLRGQLVGTIAAPLSGFVNVLSGNMRGLVNVLNAREQQLQG